MFISDIGFVSSLHVASCFYMVISVDLSSGYILCFKDLMYYHSPFFDKNLYQHCDMIFPSLFCQ